MLIDDACHYFVLLYLKAKTKNLNKNYLNKNHLTTSLIPGRAITTVKRTVARRATVRICQRHVTQFEPIAYMYLELRYN